MRSPFNKEHVIHLDCPTFDLNMHKNHFLITEGLIKTYPTDATIKYVSKAANLYGGIPIDMYIHDMYIQEGSIIGLAKRITIYNGYIQNVQRNGQDCIYIFIPDDEEHANIKGIEHLMDVCGWMKSEYYPGEENGYSFALMSFEKKFYDDVSSYIRKRLRYLYHICPGSHIEKVKVNGLCPRPGETQLFDNDERIYLFLGDEYITLKINELLMDRKKQDDVYYLLRIDLNKVDNSAKFYIDPRSNDSVFTRDNISKDAIEIIKTYKYRK